MDTVEQMRIGAKGNIEKEDRPVKPGVVGASVVRIARRNPHQQVMDLVAESDHLGLHGKIPTANGVDRAIED